MNKKKKVLIRIIVAAVLMIALSVIPVVPSKRCDTVCTIYDPVSGDRL